MAISESTEGRDRIIVAARELFATHGYRGTAVDDIGGVIGISGPAIYKHFKNKQGLLEAVCLDGMQRLLDAAQDVVVTGGDPDEILRELIQMRVMLAFGPQRLAFIVYRAEGENLSAAVTRQLVEMESLYEADWLRVLSQLRPSASSADLHLSWLATHLMIGFVARYTGPESYEVVKDHVCKMAYAAILA
jgi:AcrR family transcriptional regulator